MSHDQVTRYLNELATIQQTILDELTTLERPELRYATENARRNTVRRVLLGLGEHMREHTTQILAARESLGADQTMPQKMLARAVEAQGFLLAALIGLDDTALNAVPEPGEWAIRQVLEHLISVQRGYLDTIRKAREKAVPAERD